MLRHHAKVRQRWLFGNERIYLKYAISFKWMENFMSSEKIEWRKEEKGFSLRKKPQILTIPEQNYFSIAG